jgi:hypothetical protein
MSAKPNFTDVELVDDTVSVGGVSDEEDLSDIIDIRVVLAQGERVASGQVDKLVSAWHANLPVKDPEAEAEDFGAGPAVAFGVQTHRENFTTISWIETVTIV